MGNNAIIRLCNLGYNNDWLIRFNRRKVTVISSNFIALMLILNMAMNIHLTVRFLQLKEFPNLTKNETIFEASRKMTLPILYTVLQQYARSYPYIKWH